MVIDNVPRNSPYLDRVHVVASPRWEAAMKESERLLVEAETFAYAASNRCSKASSTLSIA